ncbi:MAG: hypothetical protein WCY34_06725 [Candidatus Omnitrophota bacterium]
MEKNSRPGRIPLSTCHLTPENDFKDIIKVFSEELNKPFSGRNEHIRFNLIYQGKRSFLGIIFDHRLMDARGAEAFLDFLGGDSGLSLKGSLYEPSHLNNWVSKFRAGREVNRFFLNLTQKKPRSLEALSAGSGSEFKVITFDREQSSKINQDALSQAGYLMTMPYILSKIILILHKVFEGRNNSSLEYLIPVSIDTRSNELARKEILFNHLSFFLFRISASEAINLQAVIDSIKEQMYNQIKMGLPQAIKEASFLMRIAPLFLIDLILKIMSKGNPASFSFAFVGAGAYARDSFMQVPVKNIFHLPRVPSPPGLGVFFNQYQMNLNAVFSYAKGLLSDDELERIKSEISSLA